MATRNVTSYFANGFIVEYAPVDETGNFTSAYCESWLLLPAENLWPAALRGALYVIAIVYLFIGVAIGSDVFMTSIEVITSKKRTIIMWDEEKGESVNKEVLVWNETVANLTLLALGSSAPEILLATVEAINELLSGTVKRDGGLGFYTIVGSAAFNLLVITGICIVSVPSPDVKKIRDFGVFILTSVWSLLAYVWLLLVLLWSSPNEVEPWEAWVTLLLFPALVLTAYAQDSGWWLTKLKPTASVDITSMPTLPATDAPVSNGINLGRRGSMTMRSPTSPERRRKAHGNNSDSVCTINGDAHHHTSNAGTPNMRHMRKVSIADPRDLEAICAHKSDFLHLPTITSQNTPEPVFKPFARARFRHAAIRSIGGRRKLPNSVSNLSINSTSIRNKSASTAKEEPRLLAVVSKLAAIRKLYANNSIQAFPLDTLDESSGNIAFASSTYAVLESAGTLSIDVLLHRRRRPTGQTVIPTTNEDGKFDTQVVTGVISVDYETREGTAKINKDFKYTSGTLIFTESDYLQTITIPIINDDQYYPDTDFYVILKTPSGNAGLGDPSVTRVTIIDDDKPGDFIFETSQCYADMNLGEVHATVLRQGGCDGNVTVHYATIDGTAIGGADIEPGVDYLHTSGVLEFKHQETSKVITIVLNKDVRDTKNFVVVLRNPSQGSNLGEHSAAVVNINFDKTGMNALSRVLIQENDTSWAGQFRSAMTVGGDVDEDGFEVPPSTIDFILHFLSMPWKVLFAFSPTREMWGGYPSFFVSLLLIGILTSVIEQLGHLLGCVANLRTQVTGITIIALGTSLPDTIASRTAALHDDFADASIGNITGSNSVNVFLGLGLPWVIRTMTYWVRGDVYTVDTTSLDFSVILFDSFGAVCVISLIFRRFILGGELGGSKGTKWIHAAFLFTLWFTFILVVSLKSYSYF